MELRQLRYFIAAAEERNISRAAQKIFLTQSALSRQIKALEDEVGQCLLERQAHSVRLTPAGEVLLREGRALLQHADEVLEAARAAGRQLRLRVGYAPSLAAGFLPVAVANFTQTHPRTYVELFDLSSAEILAGLENGRLDLGLTVGQDGATRGLRWTPLLRTPWMLAIHRDHPLAGRREVTPGEVGDEALLIFSREGYPEYWATVTQWMRDCRQRPRITGEYDGVDSLMAAVEAGQGVALVATRPGRLIPEHVRLQALAPAPEPLCIAIGHRIDRDGDQPLAVFIEEIRKAAQ